MTELFPGISTTGVTIARYFYLAVFLLLFVIFTYIVLVGAAGGVRGRGAKWSEFIFYNIWLITVPVWLALGPPLTWRAFNIGLRDSIPQAEETYNIVTDIINQASYSTPITPTVTIYAPTPEPQPTIILVATPTASNPTPTVPNIMLPAVTATSSPVPTLDPAQWNPMTPPPTRSR